MSDTHTFRCGWRYTRTHRDDLHPFMYEPSVIVRRGEWRLTLPAHVSDVMSDKDFADCVGHAYREMMFEQLEADLDVLARHLIGALGLGDAAFWSEVPTDDVKAALYRWQKVKRDMQEGAA